MLSFDLGMWKPNNREIRRICESPGRKMVGRNIGHPHDGPVEIGLENGLVKIEGFFGISIEVNVRIDCCHVLFPLIRISFTSILAKIKAPVFGSLYSI